MAGIEERIRLNKYIAKSGLYSRRQADTLIFNGVVKLNGLSVKDPSIKVDAKTDLVSVDNVYININKKIFIKFYKPINVLSSYASFDSKLNLTAFEPFTKLRLPYAGRLDYKSEGLMFFCNNGSLIERLLLPKNHIEKEYIVYVDKNLTGTNRRKLQEGVVIDGEYFKECKIFNVGEHVYRVVLYEGKKRQIRRMFKYCKVNVLRLIRIRIGSIKLGDLKPGEYAYLEKSELEEIENV
jgi:pseudouridine synthase